jgi:hypothetical protein
MAMSKYQMCNRSNSSSHKSVNINPQGEARTPQRCLVRSLAQSWTCLSKLTDRGARETFWNSNPSHRIAMAPPLKEGFTRNMKSPSYIGQEIIWIHQLKCSVFRRFPHQWPWIRGIINTRTKIMKWAWIIYLNPLVTGMKGPNNNNNTFLARWDVKRAVRRKKGRKLQKSKLNRSSHLRLHWYAVTSNARLS